MANPSQREDVGMLDSLEAYLPVLGVGPFNGAIVTINALCAELFSRIN
jgi:hypothetical protein